MNRTLRNITILILIAFLTGCGGRKANPVSSYKVGDEKMTCDEIKVEMAHIDAQIAKLIPESKKAGKNVALGAAGVFFIVPFFFMDLSDAEQVEIRAYQDRYLELEKLWKRRGCGEDGTDPVADEDANDTVKRMKKLKEMYDEGLISKDEFEARRSEILNEL